MIFLHFLQIGRIPSLFTRVMLGLLKEDCFLSLPFLLYSKPLELIGTFKNPLWKDGGKQLIGMLLFYNHLIFVSFYCVNSVSKL